ncbi:MAG: MAE_28990/MAE_18760 family HEPN-like nuclease [Snowella sp.]|nr:MAE_28990/MAE_18760 family HEPN-like nuclease [Snowella sp.]
MSQSRLVQELQEKSKEVKKYCLFLKAIETKAIKLSMGNHLTDKNKIKDFNPELEKTLKATVFLLLYNLIESTIRSVIEYIYDDLEKNHVSFDNLNQTFQNHIIKVLRDFSLKDKDWQPGIATNIIIFAAEKEGSFAGNLDAKKIREILGFYGIQVTSQGRTTRNGNDLEIVKEARKDLAHGHSSFSEKSRNYTSDDLFAIQKRVVLYLRGIVQDVENYVNEQEYLSLPSDNSS